MKEILQLAGIDSREKSGLRPRGYLDKCLELGELDRKNGQVKFTPQNWLRVRQWVKDHSAVPDRVPGADLPSGIGLGDIVGGIATPIARALKLDCIDKSTGELKPESRCQKRKNWLNSLIK